MHNHKGRSFFISAEGVNYILSWIEFQLWPCSSRIPDEIMTFLQCQKITTLTWYQKILIILNKQGPRRDPWGTPCSRVIHSLVCSSSLTLCFLSMWTYSFICLMSLQRMNAQLAQYSTSHSPSPPSSPTLPHMYPHLHTHILGGGVRGGGQGIHLSSKKIQVRGQTYF